MTPLVKAWTVEHFGTTCIVFAPTRARAKYITARAAADAGYPLSFKQIRAVRCRRLDGMERSNGRVYSLGAAHSPDNWKHP